MAIDVDPDMTVAELQGILTERTDLTKEDMRLIFGGRVIKGNSPAALVLHSARGGS